MRKLFALALTVSMPLVGVAQSPAPDLQYSPTLSGQTSPQLLQQMLESSSLLGGGESRAIPLWGTPDGRVLALIATSDDNHDPLLPKSPQIGAPSEWRLIDVTRLVSGGLMLRFGDSAQAQAQVSLGQSALPALAGCDIASSTANCANAATLARNGEFRLGANWLASDNLDFGLSYDMAWLRHDPVAASAASGGYGSALGESLAGFGAPLGLSGYSPLDAQNVSVNALGHWRFDDSQSINVGASLGRIQLSVPGAALPLTSLNQAAVSFGVRYGAFGGRLTGHVVSPADSFTNQPAARVTGLDLGISWRTPWSGMLRVGAQNLWSSGSLLPYLNNGPVSRELESSQARVPYVQYHQDL
jgi:hypothetical protein